MKIKRFSLVILLLVSLSCNFVTQGLSNLVATVTPSPTATLTPTNTALPSETPVPSATPLVPVYIPPSCQNRALATLPAATTVAEPTPSLANNPPLTKDQQLKVFLDLTNTIGKIYLYPDFNGLDWKATVAKYRAKIDAGLDTEAFYTEMSNLIAELNDNHSQFESPVMVAAADAELAGKLNYVGIGILASAEINKGLVTIITVYPDSAADHSGLKPHDSLLAVDGIPLVQDGKAYTQRVRGPECSALRLTVQSPGEKPRDMLLVRYKISTSQQIDARLVKTTDGSRIGYIFIPTFFDETIPGQIAKALESFGQLDGLILDNRMNGGGSSNVVIPILSHFVSGTVGQFVSRTEKRPFQIQADPINNSQMVPMVVLVGDGTASFGEIFSGILQDQGRAKLVGQNTNGIVELLHGYDFADGSRAWIAQERFDPAHSHANWEKKGLTLDVVASADWDTFTFDTDPGVLAAVKLLGHK